MDSPERLWFTAASVKANLHSSVDLHARIRKRAELVKERIEDIIDLGKRGEGGRLLVAPRSRPNSRPQSSDSGPARRNRSGVRPKPPGARVRHDHGGVYMSDDSRPGSLS